MNDIRKGLYEIATLAKDIILIRTAVLHLAQVSTQKTVQQYWMELNSMADDLDGRMREVIKEMEEKKE